MRLVGKKELADLSGVSPSTVTAAVRKELSAAMVDGKIDIDHATTQNFINRAASRNRKYDAGHKKPGNGSPKAEDYGREDVRDFLGYTLEEIINRFGSDAIFTDWLKSAQLIERVIETRLKNATTEGKLISREIVEMGILGPIDGLFTRLLTDGSKTMARKAYDLARAGAGMSECEEMMRKDMSSFIAAAKTKIHRTIRNLKNAD